MKNKKRQKPYEEIKNAHSEHLEGDTHVTIKLEPVEKSHAKATNYKEKNYKSSIIEHINCILGMITLLVTNAYYL